MSKADELKNNLPPYYRESKQMTTICEVSGQELDLLSLKRNELKNQLFPQTSTWALDYWEQFVGIPTNLTEDIRSRRAKVITKLSSITTITPYELRRIFKPFADKVIINQFYNEYRLEIILEVKAQLEAALYAVVEEVCNLIPCHLVISYKLISVNTCNINYAASLTCGEQISVYPWKPKDIESKGCAYIAIGNNTSFEDITIYPN